MAQAGVGKPGVGGEQSVPEDLKPLPMPAGPQSVQRTQREDLYYGPQQQNGRGVSMTSPANSLGTESLVTPNTTPEPSGSPRTLDQEPIVLPPPTIGTSYDRYMQTPPMNVPPYITYPFYSQPTVYLVHPPVSYIPHPMEPVHMPYDLSVPPPNIGYMPMASHMFPHSMYKMSPSERFVSFEQTPPPMTASPLESVAAPQVPQSNEAFLATADPAAQKSGTPDTAAGVAVHQFPPAGDQAEAAVVHESLDDAVSEIAEIIEEIHIKEDKTSATPIPPAEGVNCANGWYESVMEQQQQQESQETRSPSIGGDVRCVEFVDQRYSSPQPCDQVNLSVLHHKPCEVNNNQSRNISGYKENNNNGSARGSSYSHSNNNNNNNNNNAGTHRLARHREPHPNHRDNQRYPSNNRRDRNFRESLKTQEDTRDRRTVTTDRRYRNGNPNYCPPRSDDRRYANPEHAINNNYRVNNTNNNNNNNNINNNRRMREHRGDVDNQEASRESSAVRRDNRQRHYSSPRRDDEYRYDGNVRRTGSYRNVWREEFNGNRMEEPPKPVPRGRPDRERTNSTQRNPRLPPKGPRAPLRGESGETGQRPPRSLDEDSLEFLLPSAIGVEDPLDMKRMIKKDVVSMDRVASHTRTSRRDN